MNRENNRLIHSELIELSGVDRCINSRLKKLEGLRDTVRDSQRSKLEVEIDLCKTSIKYIKSKESELRFKLEL